jgi:CheY-like chemotaxis protein
MNEPMSSGKQKRYVLVMDDAVDDRFNTCLLLQRFDCNLFTAHTASEAIDFMTVAPPSAIIAAGPSGLDLLTWVSKDPRFFDVPVILLGAKADRDMEGRFRRGECAAILSKPLDPKEFYRIVQEVIEKSRRRNLRIATQLPVKLEDGVGGSEGFATVISEYGMFLRTFEPRPVNTVIPVVITLKNKSVKVDAVVLYVIAMDEGPFKEPGMGMKFVNISRTDRDLIAAHILEQIEEGIVRRDAGRN